MSSHVYNSGGGEQLQSLPKAIYLKKMLEALRLMDPDVRSSLIDTSRISAAKGRSQSALMEHAQLRRSENTSTGKKGLPTFMLGDTSDAPSPGSTLSKK